MTDAATESAREARDARLIAKMRKVSPRAQYLATVPPCDTCGAPADIEGLGDSEARELLDMDARAVDRDHKGTLAAIKRLAKYDAKEGCPACIKKAAQDKQRAGRYRRIEATYYAGLLPEAARNETFDKSDATREEDSIEAWRVIRGWTPKQGNLWLAGVTGVGKTFMGRCIINHQLARWSASVMEVTASDWVRHATNWDKDTWRETAAGVDVLLFDDMGFVTWKPKAFELYGDLIRLRHERGRPVIFTAQKDPGLLRNEWYGLRDRGMVQAVCRRMKPLREVKVLDSTKAQGQTEMPGTAEGEMER